MARRKLTYSSVLICWLCLLGIVACSEDDSGASAGIVGTWISRGLRTDVRATFDNDGRFIIVRIKNGSISSKGTYQVKGNLLHLSDQDDPAATCDIDIIGDTLTLNCTGEVVVLEREK